MNLTLAIAVYANICKALRLPLSFPGKPGAYTALYQCTDAALLAKAVEWMDANKPLDQQLLRFRTEAADLINEETPVTEQESGEQAEAKPSP